MAARFALGLGRDAAEEFVPIPRLGTDLTAATLRASLRTHAPFAADGAAARLEHARGDVCCVDSDGLWSQHEGESNGGVCVVRGNQTEGSKRTLVNMECLRGNQTDGSNRTQGFTHLYQTM